MKQPRTLAFILLGLMLAVSAHAATRNLVVESSNTQQKRVALVIGNSKYQGVPSLRNPVNDAKAMAEALNGLGFEVIEVTNASQREMNRAITAFGEKLNSNTAALFFYAGHGMQVRGKNYIIPVDAQIDTEAAVASEAVSVDAVLEQLNASPVSIVILDACRNNPFERSFRKIGGGLAQMEAPKGSFIAYATAPGKTAADGDGKHGLFTQELLKEITVPGLTLESVFKRVRANVLAKSGDNQNPWDSSDMTGDFYFKPGKESQVVSLESIPAQATATSNISTVDDAEGRLWQAAESSGVEEDIQTYLRQYPNGRYVAQANARIQQLLDDANQAKLQGEQEAWQEAGKENTEASYQHFLKAYPSGQYAVLATGRLDKLKANLSAKQEAWQSEWGSKGYVSQGGLIWMPVTFQKKWAEANVYCNGTAINGQTGWRLPTINELIALHASGELSGHGWKLDDGTWSSTPYEEGEVAVIGLIGLLSGGKNIHYIAYLHDGGSGPQTDSYHYYVTCVRGLEVAGQILRPQLENSSPIHSSPTSNSNAF